MRKTVTVEDFADNMAPPTEDEKAVVRAGITEELAATPYAVSSLDALTSGTTNFVFRGTLKTPLADGSTSVIIKHATAYAAVNADFALDISRSAFEESILQALDGFSSGDGGEVQAPRLWWSSRASHTQVLEDFSGTGDLKTALFASADGAGSLTDRAAAVAVGHALAGWLQAFHAWTSAPEQAGFRQAVGTNEPMRRLKHQITYDALIRVFSHFPDVLGDKEAILQEVQAAAASEFACTAAGDDPDWGLIHGDFWTGNILLADARIAVVDWEFAQLGHRAYDLGQMIGDLLERQVLRDVDASSDVLQGFLAGYAWPRHSEALAFRTAVHAGVQLMGCYIRRAPSGPLPSTPEKRRRAMQLALDLIVKGWQQDRAWLQASVLGGIWRY